MMDTNKIKDYIETQFVEDYEEIKKFMDDVNETLSDINIDVKYETYNDFCLDIEKSLIEIITEQNAIEITPNILVTALNNIVIHKMMEDVNYEEKIRIYYDDPESVIKTMKKIQK